jgi:hypothetical protein
LMKTFVGSSPLAITQPPMDRAADLRRQMMLSGPIAGTLLWFAGSWERRREPDSVIIDKAGYILLFPGEPFELGRTLEMNDHKVTIVGISNASAPWVNLPVMHTRYGSILKALAHSFVLMKPKKPLYEETSIQSSVEAVRLRRPDHHTFVLEVSHHGPPLVNCQKFTARACGTAQESLRFPGPNECSGLWPITRTTSPMSAGLAFISKCSYRYK